jgi:predicted DNA binding CopG/RHH family protein
MAKAVVSPQKKKLPNMKGWSDERIAEFWNTRDSADYFDQMEDVKVDLNVPEDFRVISLRLDSEDITRAKRLARRKGIPYTVLLRMWIKEKLVEA